MKKLRVIGIGFICGLLAGFALTEIIARIAIGLSGHLPGVLALPLGCLMPVLALAGIVAALILDEREQRQSGLS